MAIVDHRALIEAQMAEMAKRLSAPSGDKVRFKGSSSMTLPDNTDTERLTCVILDFCTHNLFYEGRFNRDNIQPPTCYSIGYEPALMQPAAGAPVQQFDSCDRCPKNQFGSDGNGKACKNTRVLAVSPIATDGDSDVPPVWLVSVPPSATRDFDKYIRELQTKHLTIPAACVTSITLDGTKTYAYPQFHFVRHLEGEEFQVFYGLKNEASQRIFVEPDTSKHKAKAGR